MVEEEDKIGWAIRARSGTKKANEVRKVKLQVTMRGQVGSKVYSRSWQYSLYLPYLVTLPPDKLNCDPCTEMRKTAVQKDAPVHEGFQRLGD